MKRIKELKEKFELALSNEEFLNEPIRLYEPIKYTLDLGGKRLRPVLCLLACEMFNGKCANAIPAAIAIEVFHNFTLLHDDIMDNSPIRRGQPTVFKKWNSNIAILSGDVMFAKAYEYVSKIEVPDLKPILNIFTDTAIKVCEGQQFDMDYETIDDVSIENYLEMIRLKTAVLIGASLQIGAMVAGAEKKYADLMYDFGVKMGLVFQLQDDILDLYSDEAKFGKKLGTDIRCGKKTYLFLKTLELLNPGEKEEFYVLYTSNHSNEEEKVVAVKKIYDKLDIKQYAVKLMNKYHAESVEILNQLNVKNECVQDLIELAESMLVREL